MQRTQWSYLIAGLVLMAGLPTLFAQTLPTVSSGTLKLWLRADASVTTDPSNGVMQWEDQGPEGNHAYQNTSDNRPIWVDQAFGNHPVIRFDGVQTPETGDFLQGSGDLGVSGAFTAFFVYSRANRTIFEQILCLAGTPGSNNSVRSSYLRDGGNMSFSAWAKDYLSGIIVPPDAFHLRTDRMSSDRTLELFDLSPTNLVVTNTTFTTFNAPSAGYFIGGLGSQTRNFQGDIAEIIYYQGRLSDQDRSDIEAYLNSKYFHEGAPYFLTRPVSQSITPGTPLTLTGSAGGVEPLSFQWFFQNAPLEGEVNSSLSIANPQRADTGDYRLVVSNAFGSVTSVVAVLVADPINILTPLGDLTANQGTNVTLSVTISGDFPRYQWLFNGQALAGQTNSTLSLLNVQLTNSGIYSVTISNGINSVTSSGQLIVAAPPLITGQPQNFDGFVGSTVTLAVNVQGGGTAVLPLVSSGSLQLWLKADMGITTNGSGRVAQWSDQSGKSNSCSQATANKQPTLFPSGMNGRPVVRFDGIQDTSNGDYLQGTGNLGLTNAFTSFVVYSAAPQSVIEQMVVAVGSSTASQLRSHNIRSTNAINELAMAAWSNDYASGHSIPTNTARVWSMRLSTNLTSLEFFDNASDTDWSTDKTTTGLLTPPAGYYVGGLGSQTRNFKGDIAETLWYRGSLSDADRLAVENYLATKYLNASERISYQWTLNGTNLVGATNANLTITNAQISNSGIYSVIISNSFASVTSQGATVRVRGILPLINNQVATNSTYNVTNTLTVSFTNAFTGGLVFYTLDGSVPSFAGQSYTGPFVLSQSATVRAIVYSADFSQSDQTDPISINFVPVFTITVLPSGGGGVTFSPGPYIMSNTPVTLTAIASNGWTFIGWSRGVSGNSPTNVTTIRSNMTVQAVFGTPVFTTAAGGGSVTKYPALALYPYGSSVRLTAVPQPGNYFGIWGNAASGNANPLKFSVTNAANPVISSLFAALGGNQVALTVFAKGDGQAVASPLANVYTNGQIITLTATPTNGQKFIGWSGDASGSQNPLSVTMNQSKTITAIFSKAIQFTNTSLAVDGLQSALSSPVGVYNVESSSNLITWVPIASYTNQIGTNVQILFPTNTTRSFYRVVEP